MNYLKIMNIGKKLKYLREYYGYNQTELAEILGTSQRNISNYESYSEISGLLAYIFKLCNFFKIPVSDFFIESSQDIKNRLPDYIKPDDLTLLKIINTGFDAKTQTEIKKIFIQITKVAIDNNSEKIKNMPEYHELFGE